MIDINPKIKPLYRDLIDLGIGNYLTTIEFDRHCIRNNLQTLWQKALGAWDSENRSFASWDTTIYDRENTLRILFNWISKTHHSDINTVVFIIIDGFIDWNNQRFSFDQISEDLELINFPKESIEKLRLKIEKLEESKKYKNKIINEPEKNEFLETNKTEMIDNISKAEIQSVIDELIAYSKKNNLIEIMKEVVNLSSRWNRVKKSFNKGIIEDRDKNLEINKINNELLEIVLSLK